MGVCRVTCPAVLRAHAQVSFFGRDFLIGCKKPEHHRGAHEPDLTQLPLSFGGTTGTWAVKIKVGQ